MTGIRPADERPPALGPARAAPLGNRDDLLAGTGAAGRALYRFVRRLLDDFEAAAPWSLLYAPPDDPSELSGRLRRLLELVEGAPARVGGEIERIAGGGAEERQPLAEAEFYFLTLHQMTAPDQRRLARALAELPGSGALARARADFLGELAADLKGKYSSAIMGAAAALVSDGRWLGVEIETRLFPEKAQEWARNRQLLNTLRAAVDGVREVSAGFGWRSVLASWQDGRPVDRYALGDLLALRSRLLRLLSIENRRALYSGDYHQLQRREGRLGERLRELEERHLESLSIAGDAPFARLQELLLEVAALIDVELLTRLIGGEQLRRLRGGDAAARATAAERGLDRLAPLVAEEDLKTFLDLLAGAIGKRSSIAYEAGEVPPLPVAKERAEAPARAGAALRIDAGSSGEATARLVAALARLTRAESGPWRSFQMVCKLQARLGVLPPALLAETGPFLSALEADLLPALEQASGAGAVPWGAVETLRACCERLAGENASDVAAGRRVRADLGRIVRLLDSLRSAFAVLDDDAG